MREDGRYLRAEYLPTERAGKRKKKTTGELKSVVTLAAGGGDENRRRHSNSQRQWTVAPTRNTPRQNGGYRVTNCVVYSTLLTYAADGRRRELHPSDVE